MRRDLNFAVQRQDRRLSGREFQMRSAAEEKDLSPHECRDLGSISYHTSASGIQKNIALLRPISNEAESRVGYGPRRIPLPLVITNLSSNLNYKETKKQLNLNISFISGIILLYFIVFVGVFINTQCAI